MNLILTRIPEIENSRYALLQPYPELPEASWTATGKTPPAPSETLRMRTRRGHSPVFRDALNSSRFRPEQKLPTDFLMNLLMFVLTCNLFIFESSFWLQIQGTAIGMGVFDMPNPQRYNILSQSIFCKIPLSKSISINIFSRMSLWKSSIKKRIFYGQADRKE